MHKIERTIWGLVVGILIVAVVMLGLTTANLDSRVSELSYEVSQQKENVWNQFYIVDEEIDTLQAQVHSMEDFLSQFNYIRP